MVSSGPRNRSLAEKAFSRNYGEEAPPEHDANNGATPITPYHPDVAAKIKSEISRSWQRVTLTKGLTQSQLAKALGTTQSAVSKLLRSEDTHPWTINYIIVFCTFCGVDLEKEILSQLPIGIEKYFRGWNDSKEADSAFLEECSSAVKQYFANRGVTPKPEQVARLATSVMSRVNRRASADDITKGVEHAVLEAALRYEA